MTNRTQILEEATTIINGDRQDDYGPIKQNFYRIAKGWEVILGADITPTQVALCMDWLKTCRLLHSNHHDSFVDKAGYAAIAGELADDE